MKTFLNILALFGLFALFLAGILIAVAGIAELTEPYSQLSVNLKGAWLLATFMLVGGFALAFMSLWKIILYPTEKFK